MGMIGFTFELFNPEKRWKRFSWWRKQNIKLVDEDETDEEEEDDDSVDGLNGGGAVTGKNEYGDVESPVLTANVYERSVSHRFQRFLIYFANASSQVELLLADS